MIHGYHLIFGAYGFWLPNDPRGSWSDFVGSWELLRYGSSTKSIERLDVDIALWIAWREAALTALKYPPVVFNEQQINSVGAGFANAVSKSHFTIWACSILPEHVHVVLGRHRYQVEQIANLLKGEATKQLNSDGLHPQSAFVMPGEKHPALWAIGKWKVYLDTEEAIENAIRYVEANPEKEGRPGQSWPFVQPFTGIVPAGWTTYH
jgi:REP element-mobilizing transposase RayT